MLRALFRAGITPDLLVGGSVGAVNACFTGSHPTALRCKLDESFDCGPVFDIRHTDELIRLGEQAVTDALAALPDDDAAPPLAA